MSRKYLRSSVVAVVGEDGAVSSAHALKLRWRHRPTTTYGETWSMRRRRTVSCRRPEAATWLWPEELGWTIVGAHWGVVPCAVHRVLCHKIRCRSNTAGRLGCLGICIVYYCYWHSIGSQPNMCTALFEKCASHHHHIICICCAPLSHGSEAPYNI